MAVEETFRHEFQARVEQALDGESARFLMAHLPPVPWPEVATKHDLELLRLSIDGRFAEQEARNQGRFQFYEERNERRFQLLQSELRAGVAEVRADMALLISNQTRTMIFALIGAVVAIASLALFR